MRSCLLNNLLRINRKGLISTGVSATTNKPILLKSALQGKLVFPSNSFQALISRCFTNEASADWSDEVFEKITKENKLVVFMKGTPDSPMCGFSKYVIQILDMHGCADFLKTFNVLDDEELRKRVKEFSNWPTIPQVYLDGEFLGGFDILLQMHQNGELVDELHKIGHRSILIDKEE